MRATIEIDRKQFPQAEADFQKAIEMAPKDPSGYVALGQWRMAQKKTADAEKLFEQALAIDPGNVPALDGILQGYAANKQPVSKSVDRVQAQLAKVPNSSALYNLAGRLAARNGDLSGAQKYFQKAVELNQNDLDAFMYLGQVAKMQGSADAAVGSWQQWAQKSPRDVRPYMLLGSFEESRDWQKAQTYYQKALEIQPDYAPAANNLAYLMLEHGGNVDMALSLAQTARRGMPNSPYSADTLAWAYYRKGLYPSAVSLLEQATKEAGNVAVFHYHLGLVYQKQSDAAKAKMHLEKALQIDPKFKQADEARQALSAMKG
jgi:tetratricopeptide (TPR) repeat protein